MKLHPAITHIERSVNIVLLVHRHCWMSAIWQPDGSKAARVHCTYKRLVDVHHAGKGIGPYRAGWSHSSGISKSWTKADESKEKCNDV